MTPYVARCYLRAVPAAKQAIQLRLCADAESIMDQIDGSSLQPFWLAQTPDDPFAKAAETQVQESLDAEISRQSPEGCWKPRWSWFGNYPESWERSEVEWSGQQTLLTLRSLRAWGRLSES